MEGAYQGNEGNRKGEKEEKGKEGEKGVGQGRNKTGAGQKPI